MDTDLVRLAQNGDKGAFASLAAARADRFLAAAHRLLRDLNLAEDATQQPLLSVCRDLPHDRRRDHAGAPAEAGQAKRIVDSIQFE